MCISPGGLCSRGLSHFIRRFNYTNNLIGSINLINASINAGSVKCFVFTSSIAVYGKNQLPMTEELMPAAEDPYGVSKLAVELDLKAAHEMFGLNSIIFRPSMFWRRQNDGHITAMW
ncbi:MAG: NAD-dependent epimerase/dehydratase family protein [Sphingobacteriaceae bacterium]|nr:NAD-dependent epimerase/dehydratase family protein [Sphingobacteriaceae bacterium]